MDNDKHWKIIVKALLDKNVDISGLTKKSIFTDLGLDSLDMFSIIVNIEKEYSIRFKDEELANFKNVEDALRILKKYIP